VRAQNGFERAPRARFIVPSSAAVYGNVGPGAIAEATPPNPISLYGRLKLEVEQLCGDAPIDTVAIRFFSVYGPGLKKQLPWELGRRVLAGESPIRLAGTGDETRDFLHVDDAADLIWRVATAAAPPRIINGGSGRATSVREFAAALAKALGRSPAMKFSGDNRPDDPEHYQADIGRACGLGWTQRIGFDVGLADYARWLGPSKDTS
jgi:UDP-glucose 4-epimerase